MKQYHSVEEAERELSQRDGTCSIIVDEVQDRRLVAHVLAGPVTDQKPPVNYSLHLVGGQGMNVPVRFFNTTR